MNLHLGNTVVNLDNIIYAQKRSDHSVVIHFIGTDKTLRVLCGEGQSGSATYPKDSDSLISCISAYKAVKTSTDNN